MRLDQKEVEVIVRSVRAYDAAAEIWLYGSRTDDTLKGGDIDLLVFSTKIGFSEKISILVDIKMVLGDQKIDLLIRSPDTKTQDAIVIALLRGAVALL